LKKIILLLIIIIPFKINALSSYVVMDKESARVLEGSNINDTRLIASITKIMTAIIAIENSNLEDIVKVDKDVLKAFGSAIYIEVGEEISLKDLLYGLMLRSGNDAAIEIANHVSNSMEDFVKLMNNKAQELNMKDTVFINDSGLENDKGEGNISSAYDMALLMRYAMNNATFREIVKTKKYTCKSSYKTYVWNNKNRLLNEYKYTIGGKTGFTQKARRTLVTVANKDNKEIIIVTLNDPNDFSNHKKLYEKNFKKYNLVTIVNKNYFSFNKIKYNGKLYINDSFKMLLTKEEEKNISIDYQMNPNNNYSNEDEVGKMIIKLDNKEITSIPIYIKVNEIKKESIFKRIINFLKFWERDNG